MDIELSTALKLVAMIVSLTALLATIWWRASQAQKQLSKDIHQLSTDIHNSGKELKDHVHVELGKLYDKHNALREDVNRHKLKVSEEYARTADVSAVVENSNNHLKAQMNQMEGLLKQILTRLINGQTK